jgi:hypothetical protein
VESTPKQLLDEYGISEVVESYVTNGDAIDVINDYIFILINKISTLKTEKEEYRLEICRLYDKYCR